MAAVVLHTVSIHCALCVRRIRPHGPRTVGPEHRHDAVEDGGKGAGGSGVSWGVHGGEGGGGSTQLSTDGGEFVVKPFDRDGGRNHVNCGKISGERGTKRERSRSAQIKVLRGCGDEGGDCPGRRDREAGAHPTSTTTRSTMRRAAMDRGGEAAKGKEHGGAICQRFGARIKNDFIWEKSGNNRVEIRCVHRCRPYISGK